MTRAARDHLVKQPEFAMQAALAALHWMSMGHGYELTALDVKEAHRLATEAARSTQQIDQAQAVIEQVLAPDRPMPAWMRDHWGSYRPTPVSATAAASPLGRTPIGYGSKVACSTPSVTSLE